MAKKPKITLDDMSEEARRALEKGVRDQDPVADLELVGLTQRTINQLENSAFEVTSVDQLVELADEDLLTISWLGQDGVNQIKKCLTRYDELVAIRDELENGFRFRYRAVSNEADETEA